MTVPGVPLSTLLSWAWIAHTIEVDNAAEVAGARHIGRLFRISLPMWTNGLRLITDSGISLGELRTRAGCGCNIGGLERWGWIAVGEDTGGRRDGYGTGKGLTADAMLRPTRAGAHARRVFASVVDTIEARWCERFGERAIDAVRKQLSLAGVGMPWSPPEVNPSDGFFTHVVGAGTTGAERPLVALLGQALTAWTVEWECAAAVSLPLAANVLRVIGAEDVPARLLPARTGLSKEAIAMAVGYLRRRGLATIGPGRSVRLTANGTDAFDAYRDGVGQRDDLALRDALEALLHDTAALSAGLRPPEGCWRNDRPYSAQTARFIADPTGALPWHPMVLHRGGWPDGS
jgi:hypothetical protein